MSAVSSLARRLGGKRWFATVGRALVPLDRLVGKLSRGRLVSLNMNDLTTLMLTTTGRKTGRARTQPLLYARDGDAFVVVGSNWGQAHHPAWSANLLAHPDFRIAAGGERWTGRARLLDAAEKAERWPDLIAHMPAWDGYTKVTDRDLRVFSLERT